MQRGRLLGACLLAAAAACTPIGLWVYDDPGLEVSRVRLDHDTAGPDPVVLGLAIKNPNDYDLSTARFELQLRLDDIPVGHFSRDSVIPVPQLAIADMALPLTVPPGVVRHRISALSKGTHRFLVEGRATFSTPFGLRDVRFAHAGDLAFGGTSSPAAAASDDSAAVRRLEEYGRRVRALAPR
ncbi:MAG TPA: LEA type 2 family protein [Gemmatimonadales bacterium]|nr:LEA type 2 family protein [Gemmatimonadales bacterium]